MKKYIVLILISTVFFVVSGVVIAFLKNMDFENETYHLHDKNKAHNPAFKDEFYFNNSPDEMIMKIYLPLRVQGNVIGKYKKKAEHNMPMIWVEDQKYYFNIRPRSFGEGYEPFYDEIDIGDSIFKNAGSLIFSVKRDTLIKNFRMSSYEQYWINPYYPQNTSTLK